LKNQQNHYAIRQHPNHAESDKSAKGSTRSRTNRFTRENSGKETITFIRQAIDLDVLAWCRIADFFIVILANFQEQQNSG
jgi:hypothetical protein